MDRFFTVMVVPEKNKKIKSFKIPSVLFRSIAFVSACFLFLGGVFIYDYWKILQEVYENKHLILENRQLKEQLQLFQIKIDSVKSDLERINTFEKKLRIITGLEKKQAKILRMSPDQTLYQNKESKLLDKLKNFSQVEKDQEYLRLTGLYNQKMAMNLGLERNYDLTRDWTELMKGSFNLAERYAGIDYQFQLLKALLSGMELRIHQLDQHILDTRSTLESTPTILPAPGWLTSSYGPRTSPYSGKLKMHEGIDIGAPFGAPIVAAADGIVTFAGQKPGFGNFVQIDHGYGIETIYAHAQSVTTKRGREVRRGDQIAKIGSTGYSTGPHLHYEVRVNGIAVDPFYFVLN